MRRRRFRLRVTGRCEPMPDRFNVLARYNAEQYRGIAHTPEYAEKMAELQAEFNEWSAWCRRREEVPDAPA